MTTGDTEALIRMTNCATPIMSLEEGGNSERARFGLMWLILELSDG